ncbi:MAG: hypothetical protein Q7T70_14530 [Polaromonas sp.]|nr:hypothetical protein [Polaromonas sp.]
MRNQILVSILLPTVLAWASTTAQAQKPAVPVCVTDDSVTERFIPVDMLTGNPMTDSQKLVLAPVDRVYPFIDELPDGTLGNGDVQLKGPMTWEGPGATHEVYERKVPRAHERYALTPDGTAMGRVYDQRIGPIRNEGKFPVGRWTQGQKRTYDTVYNVTGNGRLDATTLHMEKLSCTYEGIPGAMQYGWTNSRQSYGYIYAPGKGLVHVMTRIQGR